MSDVIDNKAMTVTEHRGRSLDGIAPAVVMIVVGLIGLALALKGIAILAELRIVVGALLLLAAAAAAVGLYMLQPNQAAVLTFFGDYRGSDRTSGLRWTNPLYRRRKFSLRIRNFSTTTSKVNDALAVILQERLGAAGVSVLEARLTDLSYSPEIAEAMLRRQQAAAVVAARRKIVEGAVWMVRDAVAQLEQGATDDDAIPLDQDRKATFATNLMTVIASDAPTSPVVNVGTLAR